MRRPAALLAAALALPLPALAEVHALVIGIDAYERIPELEGAVNDAIDIADALETAHGADVTLLLDAAATRGRILATWRRKIDGAAPGDTVVVTYAGHGANERAVYPDSEDDGMDEALLLAPFHEVGPAAGARIRDDEIAALMGQRDDIRVIFVNDSCHSGTAMRATGFEGRYRFYDSGGIVDDPLPPPPPPPADSASVGEVAAVGGYYFGAVPDDARVPEIPIEGQIRGALSYAFAAALRGAADADGDGVLRKGELERHIRATVRMHTASRQRPQVHPAAQIDAVLFGDLAAPPPPDPPGPFSRAWAELPPLPVRFAGGGLSAADFRGAVPAGPGEGHGIVVDLDRGEIRNPLGDRLRSLDDQRSAALRIAVQHTIDTMRAVHAIQDAMAPDRIDVAIPRGDDFYRDGEEIEVMVEGRSFANVTVFNLPADGTVQWLYPRNSGNDTVSGMDYGDPDTIPPGEALAFTGVIGPPFGGDHVVAIESAVSHGALRAAFNRHDGQQALPILWDDLHAILAGEEHAVAAQPYFSTDRP